LNAEVSENGSPFVVLREAGFAVYARQEIWKREPAAVTSQFADLLRPETDLDAWAVSSLYASVVPRLVLQADEQPESGQGLIFERNGQALAYFSVQEGKCGYYVQSLLHPDIYSQARPLLASVLARLNRADRIPVYFPLRRYQEWLNGPLSDAGFEPWGSQAVMVRHTVCRVEHPVLKPAYGLDGVMSVRAPIIDFWNTSLYPAEESSRVKEVVDGISHNGRSGKAQSSPSSISGRLA
jgi:hypothetical protein